MALTIDIFCLDTDRAASDGEPSAALLNDDERRRAARFRFALDRRRYVTRRQTLRRILGRYLGDDPARVHFSVNAFGKLAVPGSALGFSLSQSNSLAFFALGEGLEVGCDIEACDPGLDCLAVARRFFSPRETAALEAAEPARRLRVFYECWTRKEAYVKARGYGLSLPLAGFSVSLASAEPVALLEGEAGWRVAAPDMGPAYRAAVAANGDHWRLAPLRMLDA